MTAAACAWLAPAAAARDKVVEVASDGPGPPAYDHVLVHEMGPSSADRVLVLMPGTMGGAGDFTLLGRTAHQARRRPAGLGDRPPQPGARGHDYFEQALAGEHQPAGDVRPLPRLAHQRRLAADHYQFVDTSTLGFAREWGMKTALDDARRSSAPRGRGGREVILGGHSLGASLTAAYAAWDFHGKPGFKDVDGLVLIDGGLLGSFDAYDLAQAQEQIANLQTSNPFHDLLRQRDARSRPACSPRSAASTPASRRPTSAAALQAFPFLPDAYKPPVTVTNRALFGFDFDRDTSPVGA